MLLEIEVGEFLQGNKSCNFTTSIVVRMAEMCGTCKAKAKYECRDKLPINHHKFFTPVLHDFKHQMRLPREFVKNFDGCLSSWCTLRGLNGNEWKVQVKRLEEEVLFSRGWDVFVRDQGIENFDFIVFHYVGDSIFNVFVYDASGCEREAPHFTKVNLSQSSSCGRALHLEENDNAMSQEADYFGGPDKNDGKNSGGSHQTGNKRKTKAINSHFSALYKGKDKVNTRSYAFEDDNDNDDDMEVGEEEEEEEEKTEESFSYDPRMRPIFNTGGKQGQRRHISSRREVTNREKRRAFRKASDYIDRNISSGRPMIGIVMLSTHVYKGLYLTIPKAWAVEHMDGNNHEVELHVSGRDKYWVVGCRWSPGRQCQLRPSWADFVLNNNLEEGDVCVFELIQKGSSTGKPRPYFRVRIFRVVSEVIPLIAKRIMV